MAGTKISQLTEDAIVAGDTVAIRRGASNYAGTIGDQIAAIETITAQLQTTGTAAAFSINTDSDNNATGATADLLFDNNGGTTVARLRWDEATSTFNLGYGASNHLVIDSSGNVGIGTPSPDLFTVSGGDIRITGSTSPGLRLFTDGLSGFSQIRTNTSGHLVMEVDPADVDANSLIEFSVDNVERMRIDSSGNVAIGSTTAPNKFTVTHDEAVNTWASVSDASTDAVVKILGSNNATPYGLYLGYANSANNAQGIQAGDGTSALPLVLNPLGGNLGIGTSAPSRKLHVSDADNVYAAFSRTGATASALVVGAESGKNRIYSWTTPGGSTASPLEIVMGATTAFTIDSSGNVGIGTTTPLNPLVVSNGSDKSIEFNVSGDPLIFAYNRVGVGYQPMRIRGLGVQLIDSSGVARLQVAEGGNVGIGTTAPNANALLDLTSTTKAFMPPRMTTTQKNAIASPTAGMVVYDSTLAKLCVYTTAWETITSA